MTVIFNFVGRGDSILMLWEDGKNQKIGIIDCNKYQDENPTLDFIITNNVKEIDYILLTHPHADHFSGMRELVEHCESNQIVIKRFLHTSPSIPEYLQASVKGPTDLKELARLWQLIDRISTSGTIHDVGTISINLPYTLNNEWSMVFFAPTYQELRKVNHDLFSKDPRIYSRSYNSANYLSTLIMIYSTEKYFLLTSDVEYSVFKRELSKNIHSYKKRKLSLAQIPHHGAEHNYYTKFWKNLVYATGTPVIASVGYGDAKHPSSNVISSLQSLNFDTRMTNGLNSASASSLLSMISKSVTTGSPLTFKL